VSGTCDNRCGQFRINGTTCNCDYTCEEAGDCCADFEVHCVRIVAPTVNASRQLFNTTFVLPPLQTWEDKRLVNFNSILANISQQRVALNSTIDRDDTLSDSTTTIMFDRTALGTEELDFFSQTAQRHVKNIGTHPNATFLTFHGSIIVLIISHHNTSDIDEFVRAGNMTVTTVNGEILTAYLIEDEQRFSESDITSLDVIAIVVGSVVLLIGLVVLVVFARNRYRDSYSSIA